MVMGAKKAKNGKDAKPQFAKKPRQSHINREVCTCKEHTHLFCITCKQKYGDLEKDLLPEKSTKIKWRRHNPCSVCDGNIPCGRECTPCYTNRRKGSDCKSQDEIAEENETNPALGTLFEEQRKAAVRNDKEYFASRANASSSVNNIDDKYEDDFDEGYFYLLDDYLAQAARGEQFANLKEKVQHVSDVLGETVVRDKYGNLGVNQGNLPSGAAYKYKRGAKTSLQVVRTEDFSDAEGADDAYNSMVDDSRRRRAVSVGSDDGIREVELATDDEGEDEHYEPPLMSPPPKPPNPNRLSLVGTMDRSPSSAYSATSAPSTLPLPGLGRQRSRSPSKRSNASAISSVACSKVPPKSARDETSPARSVATEMSEKGAKKRQFDMRTCTDANVHECAEQVYDIAEKDYSNSEIWSARCKPQKMNRLLGQIDTLANKCSCNASSKSADLAAKLLESKDRVSSISNLFESVRKSSNTLLCKTSVGDATLKFLRLLDPQLAAAVFTSIGNGASAKASLTDDRAQKDLFKFLFVDSSPEVKWLNLAQVPTQSRDMVQIRILLHVAEKSFRGTLDEYTACWKKLFTGSIDIGKDKYGFFSDGLASFNHNVMCRQVWVDLSFLKASVDFIDQNGKSPGELAELGSVAERLLADKSCISVRCRSFKGQKKTDANNDVGRFVWSLIEKMAANGSNLDDVATKTLAIWASVKPWLHLKGDPVEDMKLFMSWSECGKTDEIIALVDGYKCLQHTKGTQVPQIQDMVAKLGEVLFALQAAIEAFLNKHEGLETFLRRATHCEEQPEYMEAAYFMISEAINFVETVESALESNRRDELIKKELRDRALLAHDAFDLANNDADQSSAAQLRSWYDLLFRFHRIKTVDSSAPTASQYKFLKALRTFSSLDHFIMHFVSTSIGFDGKNCDDATLNVAKELQEGLPEKVKQLINIADAGKRLRHVLQRLDEKMTVGIIEMAQVAADMHLVKEYSSLKDDLEKFQSRWTSQFQGWVLSSSAADYPALTGKLKQILAAGEDGSFQEKCPWVLQKEGEDKETEEGLKQYEALLTNAPTQNRVAKSLVGVISNLKEERAQAQIVADETEQIIGNVKEMRLIIASCTLANILMLPRTKSFPNDLKKVKTYVSGKLAVSLENLPKHISHLLKESESQQDAETTPNGGAASICSTKSASSAPSKKAKKNKFSGAIDALMGQMIAVARLIFMLFRCITLHKLATHASS